MSLIETHHISYLPESLPVHIALYSDLENASFLREQLLAGNSAFEYALIDASMVGALGSPLKYLTESISDYLSNRSSPVIMYLQQYIELAEIISIIA